MAIFIFEGTQLVYQNGAADRLIAWVDEQHRTDLRTILRDHVVQLASAVERSEVVSHVRIPQGSHLFIDVSTLRGEVRVVSVRAPGLELHAIGRHYRLSPRELEVVGHVVRGRSNRTIAELLGVKDDTVKKHLTRVFDKLGVDSRTQLISLIS